MPSYKVKAWVRFERTVEVEAESREKAEDKVYTDLSEDRLRLDYDDMEDAGAEACEESREGYALVVIQKGLRLTWWSMVGGGLENPDLSASALAAALSKVAHLPGDWGRQYAKGGYVVAYKAPMFWDASRSEYVPGKNCKLRRADALCAYEYGDFGVLEGARWGNPVPLEKIWNIMDGKEAEE